MNSNLFKSILSAVLLTFAWPINGFSILIFVAFVPLLQVLYDQPSKKSKQTTSFFFLSFFLWNLGISWWIWNASPFGMWFAVIINSWLMTFVFMATRMVIRRLSHQSGLLFLTTFWMSFELCIYIGTFHGHGFNWAMCFLKRPHGYNGTNTLGYLGVVFGFGLSISYAFKRFEGLRSNSKICFGIVAIAIPIVSLC